MFSLSSERYLPPSRTRKREKIKKCMAFLMKYY